MPRKPRGGQVGRPPLTTEGATVRKTITLTPEQAGWLEGQGNISETIRRLIDQARQPRQ
jgi:hypothetical protein